MEDVSLGEVLRQNIKDLMEWRRWNQADLCKKIGRSQPWLSKRIAYKSKFTVEDVEMLAQAFMLEPCDLLRPGHGKRDRRIGPLDRRQAPPPLEEDDEILRRSRRHLLPPFNKTT